MNEYELFKDADLSTYFFIVVNPLSGGNAASILLHTGFNYFQFRLNSSIPSTDETHHNSSDIQHPATEHGGGNAQRLVTLPLIKVFVSDIRNGTTGNKDVFHIIRAISLLKERHKPTCPPGWDSRVRVMVAGGDGTAMWTFSELQRHKVDSSLVLVGVVPFGTGNDFANATGSHLTIKLPNEDPKAMIRRLVAHWITFVAADFDLWKVRVELYSGGSFAKVDSKTRKKIVIVEQCQEGTRPVTTLELAMANYCSVGVESRIGVGFDRNRKDNAILNKAAYALEGVKKILFHRRRLIDNIVEGLFVKPTETSESAQVVFQCVAKESKMARAQSFFGGSHVARKPSSGLSGLSVLSQSSADSESVLRSPATVVGSASEHPVLQPCVSLCILNIPSFAGGADVWKSSARRLGVRMPDQENDHKIYRAMRRALSPSVHQDFGDGRLEVVAFQSIVEIGASNIREKLEKLLPRSMIPTGWRVYRGGGTFELRFREDIDATQRIYFQVDGEYYVAYRMKSIIVSPDTRIKILVRPDRKPDQTHGRRLSDTASSLTSTPRDEVNSESSVDCFVPELKERPSVLLRDVQLHPPVPDMSRVGDPAHVEIPTPQAAGDLEEDFASSITFNRNAFQDS